MLASALGFERGELHDRVVAGKDPCQPLFERVGLDRRQKSHPAVVDADHRHLGAEEALESAQHRPVSTEDDGQIRAGEVGVIPLGPVLFGFLL